VWQNFLKFPELPTLKVITAPPTKMENLMGYLRWVLIALFIWMLWRLITRVRQKTGQHLAPALAVAVAAVLAVISVWIGNAARLSNDAADEVVTDGDLLAQIYLETRRGLELANQGGARAKVKKIEVIDLDTEPADQGGFTARATWNVAGSVGHWGHIHQRQNQYQAILQIQPIDGEWKMTGLEILEERRL